MSSTSYGTVAFLWFRPPSTSSHGWGLNVHICPDRFCGHHILSTQISKSTPAVDKVERTGYQNIWVQITALPHTLTSLNEEYSEAVMRLRSSISEQNLAHGNHSTCVCTHKHTPSVCMVTYAPNMHSIQAHPLF